MATTNWRKAATGDFAKKGKWDDGVPQTHTDAVVAATGAAYTIKVISADAAHTLTLDSADATLLEKTHGSLHVGTLDIEAGTATLTQANTISSIVMTGGELQFSGAAALGDAAISLKGLSVLAAMADAEISNNITSALGEVQFAIKNSTTLELNGALTLSTTHATQLNFLGINTLHRGNGTGVVDFDGAINSALLPHSTLLIQGVTLATTIANNSAFATMLSTPDTVSERDTVKILGNGVLDLTDQNNIVTHLVADASAQIINTGSHEDLTLLNPGFGGTIQGDFDLTFESGVVELATIALKPGDVMTMINGCSFTNTHFEGVTTTIDLVNRDLGTGGGDFYFSGDTFSDGDPALDLGTGQNNGLTIDHTYSGDIINFGGHDGGTDKIFVNNEKVFTLNYQEDANGTGGQLTVNPGTASAFALNFEGHYTQGDFVVGADGNEIDCSAEQSSPHVPAHILDALI